MIKRFSERFINFSHLFGLMIGSFVVSHSPNMSYGEVKIVLAIVFSVLSVICYVLSHKGEIKKFYVWEHVILDAVCFIWLICRLKMK